MERVVIGSLTVTLTGSMSKTIMFALSVIYTSNRRATYIRQVTMNSRMISFADNMQHKFSHREKEYECYCCVRKFRTYGGMVRMSISFSSIQIADAQPRSSISSAALAATLARLRSTSSQLSAGNGVTSSRRSTRMICNKVTIWQVCMAKSAPVHVSDVRCFDAEAVELFPTR